ncbi:hypothetical protein B0J13DRAFT_619965 [Dactylonectria estremocensis]|uniref:Ketohexokinase n=1 Tax=Dactylonectria estremocensis TaxID=1079267 RepID=A0A9P9F2K9_9HYPO|nr:hypothetical protein B0J13DRAFT_619965 [Dactylonectria estremocensis]
MKHLILTGAVPFFPSEDSKLRATALTIRRGGNCPNSIEVLEQLLTESDAVQPYLVSCLPNVSSAASRRIVASFGPSSKLDFRHCVYNEASTEAASSYAIRSLETGSRTLVNYNDLPEITTEQFDSIARSFSPDEETWWHFEGRIPDTTLKCMRLLRNVLPNAQISVEVEKPGREGLPELAAEADVVFYSRSWAEGRGHESPESCLRTEVHDKASLALCTWGAGGAAGLSRAACEYVRCPAKYETEGGISVVEYVKGEVYGPWVIILLACGAKNEELDVMGIRTSQPDGLRSIKGHDIDSPHKGGLDVSVQVAHLG